MSKDIGIGRGCTAPFIYWCVPYRLVKGVGRRYNGTIDIINKH